MSETELSTAFPLDRDGFLRRECPSCEREFKWLPAQDEAEATPPPDGGYFCPYCAIQAQPQAWHTKAQVGALEALVQQEVVGPALKGFADDLRRMERESGGLIEVSTSTDPVEEPEPLTEVDDMRRVDFGCHPGEPIKVREDWARAVRCLVCGQAAS